MTRLKPILWLVAAGGLGLIFVWRYKIVVEMRAENESLRRQVEQLSQPQTTGTSPGDNSLTPEQMSELLKLRGEVTQLRQQTNEMASLRAQNQKLLASLKDTLENMKLARTNAVAKSPKDALPQDIHPKESWAFRGLRSQACF
jgi:cell division protein FtsB